MPKTKARVLASVQFAPTMDEVKPLLDRELEKLGTPGKITYHYWGIVDGYVTYEAEAEVT